MNPISFDDIRPEPEFEFKPKGFNNTFFEKVPREDRKYLFHHIFFDLETIPDPQTDLPLPSNTMLASIVEGYEFLSKTIVGKDDNLHFRNPRMIDYISDFLTSNNFEQFYLFLYRVDSLWRGKLTPSAYQQLIFLHNKDTLEKLSNVMHSVSDDFFAPDADGNSTYSLCADKVFRTKSLYSLREYFSAIGALHEEKPSYAYALIVLWSVLNVQVIYFLKAIKEIIVYQEQETTVFDERKGYIIKSAISDDLYLSALKTLEPLSVTEETPTERELIFSVNSGKFHKGASVFEIQRVPKNAVRDAPAIEEVIDIPKAQSLMEKIINNLKEIFVEKLATKLKTILSNLTSPLLAHKTLYYIKVNGKYLNYPGWFANTRIRLLDNSTEKGSQWFFSNSPSVVGIYNARLLIFAVDIPNGGQLSQSLMWCFPTIGQDAQRFTIHEVKNWKLRMLQLHDERERRVAGT